MAIRINASDDISPTDLDLFLLSYERAFGPNPGAGGVMKIIKDYI